MMSLNRPLHGFATKNHNMWENHGVVLHGCQVLGGPNRNGSDLHCHRPPRGPLARVHPAGIIL